MKEEANSNMLNVLNYIAIIMMVAIVPFSLWLAYFGYKSSKADFFNYPEAEPHTFAIIICARNEAEAIGRCIENFNMQYYPDDKYDIYVVAHNCTDNTAETAAKSGANVIICDDPQLRRKADAISAGVNHINNIDIAYDYVLIFDADGVAEPNYLIEMNRALSSGADIAQGYIIPSNYYSNIISKLAGILYIELLEGNAIGLDRSGLPVTLYGCGFAFKSEVVKDGWHTLTLVEDFELMVKEVLKGRKIILADKARAYFEMPINLGAALKQRRRWTIGDAQCTGTYIKQYIKNIKNLGMPGIKVTIELLMIPLMMLLGYGIVIELALIAIRGITQVALITIVTVIVIIYLSISFIALSSIRKAGYSLKGSVTAVLLSPLWASIMVVYAMESLWVKDIEWEC